MRPSTFINQTAVAVCVYFNKVYILDYINGTAPWSMSSSLRKMLGAETVIQIKVKTDVRLGQSNLVKLDKIKS